MGCNNSKLTKNILHGCLMPKQGVENSGEAILINYSSIDRSATTVSGASVNLVLLSGETGYKLSYYKQMAQGASSFAPSDDSYDGFVHQGILRMPHQSADTAERSEELAGGLFIVVLKTKFEGVSGQTDTFKIFGYENGMTLSELTTNTNTDGASILFTLQTPTDAFESKPFHIFYDTSYSASLASFDSAFAEE